jgi:thiol-disulfide isomerase/thioredoxin
MKYIYFGATWCGPCQHIKPLVTSSSKVIQIVDVDTNTELANKYNVRSVPTLIGVIDDRVQVRYSGATDISNFLKK